MDPAKTRLVDTVTLEVNVCVPVQVLDEFSKPAAPLPVIAWQVNWPVV